MHLLQTHTSRIHLKCSSRTPCRIVQTYAYTCVCTGIQLSRTRELQAHHDHARHPEEEDVVPCHTRWCVLVCVVVLVLVSVLVRGVGNMLVCVYWYVCVKCWLGIGELSRGVVRVCVGHT